ncbi:MAG: hypothetical protein ACK4Z6_06570, partial [Candidatus Methylomirabilales bacterium]
AVPVPEWHKEVIEERLKEHGGRCGAHQWEESVSCPLTGLTPEQASRLLTPTMPNPAREA